MTESLTPLDAGELSSWLIRLSQTVDQRLRGDLRSEAAVALRRGLGAHDKVALPVLLQLAFLADCLHAAQLAIDAGGGVERDELERAGALVRVAASKYFFALPAYESFDETVDTPAEVARFLAAHRDDPGPFGFRSAEDWRGLALARLVERSTRDATPLQDHERMVGRIVEAVLAGRGTERAQEVRRLVRERFAPPGVAAETPDPRAVAFCRGDGPEVFASIAHGSQLHERDPFDVETIHADARRMFHQLLERAATPWHTRRGHGRTLLVLGDPGSGKTHLLRAFRSQVHGRRLGYAGYLQLTSDVDGYARFVLRSLIDSLEQPYDAPSLPESALVYLSNGLAVGRDPVPAGELESLRTAQLSLVQLQRLVGALVDRIVRTEGLDRLEVDLVQALLLLQRRDPALRRRVVRFLRCEALNTYDRQLLCGLAPRDRADDPLRTLRQLAAVMYELQLAPLVLLVDQVEDAIPDRQTITPLQQALDGVRSIADAIPSSVVVLSCVQDVYDAAKPKLSQALLDRLGGHQLRLASQRRPDEVEQLLVRRLAHLYACLDVAWREDDPLYPFTPRQIDAASQLRTRDCLCKLREYHDACITAGVIVGKAAKPTSTHPAPPATKPSVDDLWYEVLAVTDLRPSAVPSYSR